MHLAEGEGGWEQQHFQQLKLKRELGQLVPSWASHRRIQSAVSRNAFSGQGVLYCEDMCLPTAEESLTGEINCYLICAAVCRERRRVKQRVKAKQERHRRRRLLSHQHLPQPPPALPRHPSPGPCPLGGPRPLPEHLGRRLSRASPTPLPS